MCAYAGSAGVPPAVSALARIKAALKSNLRDNESVERARARLAGGTPALPAAGSFGKLGSKPLYKLAGVHYRTPTLPFCFAARGKRALNLGVVCRAG